ncbi:hypothetical protein [Methylorubrum extorquens]|jgi:hypothetical protein|uniref:hypothetical protein n=1 Tax=Methylorubrum extorquens TaxID=408 RepID=UPI00223767E0|nr:hypothetical protein [Methylorubrum extorquens]UYW27759.1 hypothetical protein OKC48_04390 [Methylorubrum extorquens]UYW32380.1 hypothetical protein OKB92_26020 [Methylorubrum extorquens]
MATTVRWLALPLVLGGSLAVSGCTGFGYISQTYVSQVPQVVTIGCNEPYEVYDNRQRRRVLVVSNALREVTGCDVGRVGNGRPPAETRAARFRTAARTYLDETVREDCKITGEIVFSDLQTEFAYACDAPVEPRGTAVPRLPGRRNQR